ncbi:MAG TPA: glycosyltransferase family 4 protein [Burkholderiales bacterium]|nr:glycosyltransferase family 4 protein [Burkholderiales bacterium]
MHRFQNHKTKKLALVIYASLDALSGGYLYDRKLVEYLRAHGDSVEIISLPWRNYAAHLADNLSFRLPPGLDLVIEDELNHPSLLAANRRPHPYPVISLVHHLRSSEDRSALHNTFYRWIERRYLQGVDGFIFNSRTTQAVVQDLVGAAPSSLVAYPPTDRFEDTIKDHEIRARAESDEFGVLFLGNVIRRKGLHTLLEAMRQQTLDIRLDVVGSLDSEPKYAREMQSRVEALGLESKVLFHGPLAKDELLPFLRQAHVLAVPSSYEGFGIVYLEGMAFGLPAIGTTAGAASEIITDGVDGFLVRPGDANSLADGLRVLAGNRDLLARMSLAARARYNRQPKWETTAGQVRAFLKERIGYNSPTTTSPSHD